MTRRLQTYPPLLCEAIAGIPYIDMLLGPQKTDRGHASNTVKHEESQTPDESQTQTKVLPAPEEVLVTLRLQVGQLSSSRSVSPH